MAVVTVAAGARAFASRPLWKALAAMGAARVEFVVFVASDARGGRDEVGERLVEVRVPRRPAHELLLERTTAPPDLALALHHHHTPEYDEALERSAAAAAVVVAAGAFAAPALQRFTRAPLIVDALDVLADRAWPSAALAADAARRERRACRTAALVRACSARHAEALAARHGLDPARVATIGDGAVLADVGFTPPRARAARARTFGLDVRPVVLALDSLTLLSDRPRSAAAGAALDELARDVPRVRLIRSCTAAELPALLGVAAAAIALDDGPGAAGDVVTLAQAGVPLVAEPGVLRDTGLQPGSEAVCADRGRLADALRRLLAAPDVDVAAARERVAPRTHAAGAKALLADARFAQLLASSRPLRRRPRPRRLLLEAA